MRTILIVLLFAALASTASAVQYVTLPPGTELGVDPSALIEVTVIPGTTQGNYGCSWSYATGGGHNVSWRNDEATRQIHRLPLTGVNRVRADNSTITIKITPESEINVVAPGTVLVLPEETEGNFDIIIETSDDLVKWMPFFSQTVNSATAAKFFRTRVTKTP